MSIISKRYWSNAFTRVMGQFGYFKMPSGLGGLTSGGFMGFSNLGNKQKQLEAYQNHVYKCVSLIYRRCISVPMRIYKTRESKNEEIKRHPFIDLMKKPNPYMTGRLLKAVTIMHLDLTGMAMWLKVFNGLGRPAELWPLPIGQFTRFVMSDAGNELLGYEFFAGKGGSVVFKPEEVVYFRYPHPFYLFEGASPIQAMAFAYDTDQAIRIYQRRFFQNSARPDVTLTTDQKLDKEDAKRLLLGWKQAHQGVESSWEPAILDQGLKAVPFGTTAKDFEFASLAKWTKEDILEAYGIPEGKLGSVKDVNRANGLAIDITFNSECISPRLDLFEEVITNEVLSHYDAGIYAEHVSCIPRDLEYDLKERESNLKNKFTTINEERAKEGKDPVPWGNKPFIQINEIQWGDELNIVREGKSVARGADRLKALLENKDARENFRRAHERRVAARVRAYRPFLRKFFDKQEKEVLANLDANYRRIEGVTAGMSIKRVRKWLEEHKDQVDDISFDMATANESLTDGSGPYIKAALIDAGELALADVGASDIVFDLLTSQALEHLKGTVIKLKDVNKTTHDMIRKELEAGLEAGESMQQLAARIRKVFENADKVRSLRIAQTEINSTANFGSLEGYRQSGVVEAKGWLAGADARETHQQAEARYAGDGVIPLGQDFEVGDGRGPAPGSIGLPEEDINCRCTILPVVRAE